MADLAEEYDDNRSGMMTKQIYLDRKEAMDRRLADARETLAEHEAALNLRVLTDTEIKNRVHLISDIFKVAGDLDTLDFAQRRKLIELLGVTGVIGLKDGRPYAEIIWCGEPQENMWLDTDESNERGPVPEESRTS